MKKQEIIDLLKDHNQQDVEKFTDYCISLHGNTKKYPFMSSKSSQDMSNLFKRVHNEGLVFDGKHITLQYTGISFDYIALKNKMLLSYPETYIDVQLVYEGDEYDFCKNSGKVDYSHKISDPFNRSEDKIIGGYCVIKNKRGEFLTTLNKEEIDKHRKVAKTDFIWKAWFAEMCLKTIIKKAVKIHFEDIYSEIIELDNEENNLDIPVDIRLSWKQEIDDIQTMEELKEYYLKNKGKGKDFDKYVSIRKNDLTTNEKEDENS